LEQSDFVILVRGLNQAGRHSRAEVVFGCETLSKRIQKSTNRPTTAAGPLTKWSEGKVADQFLPKIVWRPIQQPAHILERKGPGKVVGHYPAISIVVKLALDSACLTIEPSEVLCGLL
jgi:hypothetical protein